MSGFCERFNRQPSKRQRIIITRSCEPITHQIQTGGGVTERERFNINDSTLKKMNETYHFKDDSLMSIQAGQVRDAANFFTAPFGSATYFHKSSMTGAKPISYEDQVTVDIATPVIPDAMQRIKQRQADAKAELMRKKQKMADQMEASRRKVLDSYKI